MKRLRIASIFMLGYFLISTNLALAEIPEISILVTAGEKTEFGKIFPVVSYLRGVGVSEIDFAIGSETNVSVTIRFRFDIEIITKDELERRIREREGSGKPFFVSEILDKWTQDLKKAGAESVIVEKVEAFPLIPFTIDDFNKARKQQKQVVVVCRADWNILSQKMDKELFENAEVIRAVKQSKAAFLVIDLTERSPEPISEFIKKHNLTVPNFYLFEPGKDSPKILEGPLTAKKFLKSIGVDD